MLHVSTDQNLGGEFPTFCLIQATTTRGCSGGKGRNHPAFGDCLMALGERAFPVDDVEPLRAPAAPVRDRIAVEDTAEQCLGITL